MKKEIENNTPYWDIIPGTLVRHKVFETNSGQVSRYGIVLSQNHDGEQSWVYWNHCEEYPVSKLRSNYSSFVRSSYLEIVSEMPQEDYL